MTLKEAYDAGKQKATEYEVGDVFLGASPEAELRGLTGELRTVFMTGYLANLPRRICSDESGHIREIVR